MIISLPTRSLKLDLYLFVFLGLLIGLINMVGYIFLPQNNQSGLVIRSLILISTVILCYYLNFSFTRKNNLGVQTLEFKYRSIKYYLGGVGVACLLLLTILAFIYLLYPFTISINPKSKVSLFNDFIFYTISNTLEELLFRGFFLIASVKIFGKAWAIVFVSLLFGLFHLLGTGVTMEGLRMVITTFSMSLLFISVIYYTSSIWPAVTLHITLNFLLHSLGFDGTNNGLFQMRFNDVNMNGFIITLIFASVVLLFAWFITRKNKQRITSPNSIRRSTVG